jgi:hypothetical protein
MEAGRRSHQRRSAEIGEVTVAGLGYRHPESFDARLPAGGDDASGEGDTIGDRREAEGEAIA